MIDLESALAPLVESAPGPPEVANVVRRARQRRLRRRGALATALVVMVAGVAGAVAITSSRHPSKVSVLTPPVESVRVTLLDGSQLEISGPPSLGLTSLVPEFSGALVPPSEGPPRHGAGYSFFIGRAAPGNLGAVIAQYPTADGHELVVHANPYGPGTQAVVQYGDWWLYSDSDGGAAGWTSFAAELNVKRTADGYFVVEPVDPGWHVGPADAPDVTLGGGLYGVGASFGFYAPTTHPEACPVGDQATERTPEGWRIMVENGVWWCDGNANVRVAVWHKDLIDVAIQGLRVTLTDAQHEVDRVTTLDGTRYEITAPASELDHFIVQKDLAIDGIPTSSVTVVEAERTDDAQHGGDAPHRLPDTPFMSRDGHQLVVTQFPLGDIALAGEYGDWTVYVTVTDLSDAERARVASLFAAHETADGFLVLDPAPGVHLHSEGGSDIVLDHVDIGVSDANGNVEVTGRDRAPAFADQVHVTRIESVP